MSVSTKNPSEKTLEKALEDKPVSVYSINFARVINNLNDQRLVSNPKKGGSLETAARKSLSKKVFQSRNAIAVAAILAIGVLHFAFQMSFIRYEVSKNRTPLEVPPVKIEQHSAPSADNNLDEFESKKADVLMPEKTAPSVRRREAEIAPAKPKPKKKEAFESRTERLRRAEKILTGV
ncbi:MAG TPA: hypothetical protein VGC97_09260 [Pyrinomonadaceae bacterium]|jgi:hypothetical protein